MSSKTHSASKKRMKTSSQKVPNVEIEPFGPGKVITLRSQALQVSISTLGATLQSVKVYHPGKKTWTEVNVHYPNFEEALADSSTYFGATVGRFAGRVGHGKFVLDNVEYETPKNAGEHTIHGGGNAFDKKQWGFKVMEYPGQYTGVRFFHRSPHMENGFPAELQCSVYYFIPFAKPSELHMEFDAFIPETSPASATIVNMFNHAYWNLNGIPPRHRIGPWKQPETVLNHILSLPDSHHVIETNSAAVPTGNIIPVSKSLNFLEPRRIGDFIDSADLNRTPGGYDHPLPIDSWKPGSAPQLNAVVYSPSSEIKMKVFSTFPCIWVYTANNLKNGASGEKGERYARHTAVCLEPQHFPDAANHEFFPQSVVRRGKPYKEEMINVFSIMPRDKPSKL